MGSAVFHARHGAIFLDTPEPFADFIPGGAGVPEPGAWALMLTGLGLAGAALRRRSVAPART